MKGDSVVSTPDAEVDETTEVPEELLEQVARAQREGRAQRGMVVIEPSDLPERTEVRREPRSI